MKNPNKIFAFIILLLATSLAYGQQDPMISQYMTNQIYFNPAYAGTHDYASASAAYRKQWVSFPGSPETEFISLDKNFVDRNVGLGLTIVNDKIGVSNKMDIAGQYAYHIPVGYGHLSLGIKAALSYYSASVKDLTVWDENDKVYANNIVNRWSPNFGLGAYYYTEKFYAGVSAPYLVNYNKPSNFVAAELSSVPNYERHYFIATGYVIGFHSDVYVKPSILIKYVEDAPMEADFNINVYFMNMFSVGAAYRTNDGYVVMAEILAAKRLRIGYAFDWPTNQLTNYTNGTHEIMVSYDFIRDIYKMKTPRFF